MTVMVVGKSVVDLSARETYRSPSDLVGTSGTGRTTFVNTLCESNVLDHAAPVDPKMAHLEPGIQIKPITVGMSMQISELR